MNIRYRVTLTGDEREQLQTLVSGGKGAVRRIKRAQILLAADARSPDQAIAINIGAGTSTVYRTKQRFVEEGLEQALSESPRPGALRKLDASDESLLIAVACSRPPGGRAKWTMQLLADEMVRLTRHDSLSDETIRRRMAEMPLKPWQEKMWCIPEINAEYVARMEDVLQLYAETPDPRRPVVCFDETPRQLIGEARVPIPAEPGKPRRVDYEYVRNGTANLFVIVEPLAGTRHVTVTDRRTIPDFAAQMKYLCDELYPDAEVIRVVLDNLNTHAFGSLFSTYPPDEAWRLRRRLEFHFTPKHASWLNMAECELSVLSRQCLARRLASKERLSDEVASWVADRNRAKAKINWTFRVANARKKLSFLYPKELVR